MVRGGRAAGGSRLTKDKIYTHAQMGTIDTNPEILMSMVVSHRNRHKGVFYFLQPTQPCCCPRALMSK